MFKRDVNSPEDALLYMTDCTLATVGQMAMLKRKSKGEYERQQSIAQFGVDKIRDYKIDYHKGGRVETIIEKYNGKVGDYAKEIAIKWLKNQ